VALCKIRNKLDCPEGGEEVGVVKHFTSFVFLFCLVAAFAVLNEEQSYAAVSVSVGVNTGDFGFLGNYGTWVDVSGYGRVWRPHAYAGWRPFAAGQWVWTDQGWMWISSEPYGWAVYHYGNWTYTPRYGWVWIPGYDWSPARVQWNYYGDYVSWAPLSPRGVRIEEPWVSARYWNVVRVRDFNRPLTRSYFVTRVAAPAHTVTVIRTAPEVARIETVQKRKIEVVHVNETNVQGGSHQFKKVEVVHAGAREDAGNTKVVEKEKIKTKQTHKKNKDKEKHHE
jgi:hypothetical protein